MSTLTSSRSEALLQKNANDFMKGKMFKKLEVFTYIFSCFKDKNTQNKYAAKSQTQDSSNIIYNAEFAKNNVIQQTQSYNNSAYSTANSLLPAQPFHKQGRKTLLIDLDETLVHSSVNELANPHLKFQLKNSNKDITVHTLVRPNAVKFLEEMAKLYEIVIFTASLKEYADEVINFLDPKGTLVDFRIYRDSCTIHRGNYTKDLTNIGRDLNNTILLDNAPFSFVLQPENGLLCSNFIEDLNDRELNYLTPFLKFIALGKDVTQMNKMKELYDSNKTLQQTLANGSSISCNNSSNKLMEEGNDNDEVNLQESSVQQIYCQHPKYSQNIYFGNKNQGTPKAYSYKLPAFYQESS